MDRRRCHRSRRRFLQTAAGGLALLAGCADLGQTDDEPDRDPAQVGSNPDVNADADNDVTIGWPTADVTVVDFETAPLTAVVTGSVRTEDGLGATLDFDSPATASSPATLSGVIANHRNYEQTFDPTRLVVLNDPAASRSSGDATDTAYLVPTAEHPLAETVVPSSRDDDGRWRVDTVHGDWYPETLTLEPEQRLECEYHLLGHHERVSQPIEAGRYEFGAQDRGFAIAVWPTDAPGPDGDSQFSGTDVPALPESVDEEGAEPADLSWYHEATPETPVYLEPDQEAVTAPARIEFNLVNHSDEYLSGNPHQWRLSKLVAGEWYRIAPDITPDPLSWVAPGTVTTSTLDLYDGRPIDRDRSRTVGYLGGGRYAYSVGYSVDGETHAALFDLDAPPLAVEPEPDATVDDTGNGTAADRVVRLPNYEDARRPATVTITRVDSHSPSDADASTDTDTDTGTTDADTDTDIGIDIDAHLIPEQLPRRRFRSFRNTLPLFDDDSIDRVVLETDRGTALGWFGYEEATRTVSYKEAVFEVAGALESD
ncbi:hypothetical protein C483_11441 [Natrialba hulunbeirensis JCM 10989]|uniref:Uncharacterized protein n=1 Tax=Natrialba hulunbeirensis JCM 10989 TaxID=1227493 RepID=L9ZX78_9EURY|nr:hypothetical protein [Natrialba hulunbeirensis]ELY90671.1 hypothetical protein C483_11441 [Natrialba hulunbeirensis JCM 10989]